MADATIYHRGSAKRADDPESQEYLRGQGEYYAELGLCIHALDLATTERLERYEARLESRLRKAMEEFRRHQAAQDSNDPRPKLSREAARKYWSDEIFGKNEDKEAT